MSEHVSAGCDRLRADIELLLAKYAGRSKWVGYEAPRREAWAEIETDLRDLHSLAQRVFASAEGDAE